MSEETVKMANFEYYEPVLEWKPSFKPDGTPGYDRCEQRWEEQVDCIELVNFYLYGDQWYKQVSFRKMKDGTVTHPVKYTDGPGKSKDSDKLHMKFLEDNKIA